MPRPTALGGYGAVAGPERTERPRPPSRSRWLALVAAPLAVVVVCAATLRPRAVAPLAATRLSASAANSSSSSHRVDSSVDSSLVGTSARGQNVTIETVVATAPHAVMKLTATLRVHVYGAPQSAGPFVAAVKYAPAYTPRPEGHKLVAPLWSRNVTLSSGSNGGVVCDITVLRLRPGTNYDFHVFISAGGAPATLWDTVSAMIPSTGIPRFDEKPLAEVSGGTPSWEMLSMAYEVSTRDQNRKQTFTGVVAVDAAGWVVWYYHVNYKASAGGHSGTPAVWDFLPASEGHAMVLLLEGYDMLYEGAGGERWRANSALLQVAPDGALERQYVQACTGTPMNFNGLTHELRVDHTSDELRVLTVGYRMGAYDDKTVALKTGPDGNEELWHVDKFAGVRVFAWDRDASKLHELYDMFDFAAPDAEPWLPAETTWTKKSGCECSGNESLKALDYHHVSSISVGLEGSLLVSSRNLNTVFALDARGGGNRTSLKWKLSSLPGMSDFEFERDIDRFYAPHDVVQLSDSRLLMIDDGSSRPGCTVMSAFDGCWSRAVLYELDIDAQKVKLVWQFEDPHALRGGEPIDDIAVESSLRSNATEVSGSANWTSAARAFDAELDAGDGGGGRGVEGGDASAADREKDTPTTIVTDGGNETNSSSVSEETKSKYYKETVMVRDLYNFDGGSVRRLESGRILVAFTSPYSTRLYDEKYSMRAYEVDKDGEAIVSIVVPHSGPLGGMGSYRFVPMKTVSGESRDAPFLYSSR